MNGGIGLALGSLGVVTRARATRMARLLVHQSPEIPHELRYPAVGGFDRGVVAFRVHLLSSHIVDMRERDLDPPPAPPRSRCDESVS